MVAEFLRHTGWSVSVAANGTEGLRNATYLLPNVILVDYRMANEMDGVEFLRILRQQRGGDAPNVAIFTADWDVLDRSQEVHALDAIIASKLCDLDQVSDLVLYLSTNVERPPPLPAIPWWRRWTA